VAEDSKAAVAVGDAREVKDRSRPQCGPSTVVDDSAANAVSRNSTIDWRLRHIAEVIGTRYS